MEIEVRVQPKAKRNSIEVEGERLKVRVTAAPEDGKANAAVVALLAKKLRVAKSSISIKRGHKSREKLFSIEGLSRDELLRRLSNE